MVATERALVDGADTLRSGRLRHGPAIAWTLMLVTAFPWTYDTSPGQADAGSSLDDVKLLLATVAILIAFFARERRRLPVPHRLLAVYALVAAVGAVYSSASSDGLLRSVRLLATVLAVVWICHQLGVNGLLYRTLHVSAAVCLSAAAGGVLHIRPIPGGRLTGLLPPMHPNLLACVAVVGLLCAVLLWGNGDLSVPTLVGLMLVFAFVVVRTGSRTGLVSAAAGLLVMGLISLAAAKGRIIFACWFGSLGLLVTAWVDVNSRYNPFGSLLTRNGSAIIDSTLTGRTFAWSAALSAHYDPAERWFGQGLQVKSALRSFGGLLVPQGIDNAWLAAYVAAGLVGLMLFVLAMLGLLAVCIRARSASALTLLTAAMATTVTGTFMSDVSYLLVVAFGITAAVSRDTRSPA
jgi:hypothetical protein